jgi:hypothetical protein
MQAPPGNRSGRKQSEHTKWLSEDYAWLLHRGTGGVMSTRKAYATREDDTRDRLRGGISLACARAFASARANIVLYGAAAEVEKEGKRFRSEVDRFAPGPILRLGGESELARVHDRRR